MGFIGNLLQGARGLVDRGVNDVVNTRVSLPFSHNTPVSLNDVGNFAAPAITSGVMPAIKDAGDLVGTIGGWLPVVGHSIHQQKDLFDQTSNELIHQAHQQLGVTDHNSLVQAANLIPKITGWAVSMDTGAGEAKLFSGLAGTLAKAGVGAKALGHLNEIADASPTAARLVTNYMLHPETDISLLKAAMNPKAAGASIRLAKAAGAAVGGSLGFNVMDSAQRGQSLGQTGKNIALGTGIGVGAEFGMDRLAALAPKIQDFVKSIQESNAVPAVKQKMAQLGDEINALPGINQSGKIKLPGKGAGDVPTPENQPKPEIGKIDVQRLNHQQQAKAEQDANLINQARLIEQEQKKAAEQAGARGTGLNPIGKDFWAQKMAELKDKAATYTQERYGHLMPSQEELAQSNKNAEAEVAARQTAPTEVAPGSVHERISQSEQQVMRQNPGALPKLQALATQRGLSDHQYADLLDQALQATKKVDTAKIPLTTEASAAARQDPKFSGGSAQENVAGTPMAGKGRPTTTETPATAPKEKATVSLPERQHDEHGNVTAIINRDTGEKFTLSHDGSPMSRFKNELIRENKNDTAYGRTGRDVSKVHGSDSGGRAGVLAILKNDVVDHIKSVLSPAEQQQLTHYAEGSLKASEVSPAVKEIGDQWKEIERLGLMLNREASAATGEVDNGIVSHVEHINLDKKGGLGSKIGLGKFTAKNSTQQGRSIIKLTSKGKTVFGDPEALGYTKMDNGTYQDKFGKTWHPQQATIKELNDNGFKYESNSANIINSTFGKYAKTANNLKLGRNLAGADHGRDIIPRSPGETTPPKGYHASTIPGLNKYWMSNKYHGHLYTAADSPDSAAMTLAKLAAKPVGAVTHAVNQAFFTLFPGFHAFINEAGQSITTFGIGKGPISFIRSAKNLGTAAESFGKRDENFLNWMREGGSLSHSQEGLTARTQSAWQTIKQKAAHLNFSLRLNNHLTEQIGTTVRYAKAMDLVKNEGMTMRQAIATVDRVQGDYGNLNKFEKEVATKFVQFYPFVKHQIRALGYSTVGAVKNPKVYGGAAAMAALTYAAYSGLDKAVQSYTGNKYANIRKGGMLGFVDDVKDAPGQVKGYTDKSGKKQPGHVPSVITNRLNSPERVAIEQATGKSLINGKDITDRKGEVKSQVAEVQDNKDLSSGKKSVAEIAMRGYGVKLPHGQHVPAAPALDGRPVGDLINVSGQNSKKTVDVGNLVKSGGGSKLMAYQVQRASGDHSLDSFFQKNPELDPLSPKFKGYDLNSGQSVLNGKNLMKAEGGSSLTYMQALKLSGSKEYDQFFKQHPELDPTDPNFQGMKKGGNTTHLKKVSAGKTYHAKVSLKKTAVPKSAMGIGVRSSKSTKVKLTTVKAPTAPRVSKKLLTGNVKA